MMRKTDDGESLIVPIASRARGRYLGADGGRALKQAANLILTLSQCGTGPNKMRFTLK